MKSDVDAVIGTMKMLTYRQYGYGHTGDKAGFLKSQIFKTDLKVKKSSVAYDNYDKVGNLLKYHLSVNDKKNAKGFTSTHRLEYEKAQGYQQTVDRAETKFNNGQSSSGVSTRYYDVNGNLQEARDANGEHSIFYLNDSREGVKERKEKDSVTGYLNVGGNVIADIKINKSTNEQTLDVYSGFTPQGSAQKSENPYKEGTMGHALNSAIQWQQHSLIAGANITDFLSAKEYYENAGKDATGAPTNLASDNLGSYTVKGGDTLQSIALEVYGDASLWYLIADANGITNDNAQAGQTGDVKNPNRTNGLQPGT